MDKSDKNGNNIKEIYEKLFLKAYDSGFSPGMNTIFNMKNQKILDYITKELINNNIEPYILNKIIEFYSRYYNNGNFTTKSRFFIDYEGEELLFHWNHKGEFYICSNKKTKRDYFLNENLTNFLNSELEFFIKNKIMNEIIDKNISDEFISYFFIIRNKCLQFNSFLGKIEDIQIKLWNNTKESIISNYLITIDLIPDKYFKEILSNKQQIIKWKNLFGININSKKDLIFKNTLDGLVYKKLMIDTELFPVEFESNIINDLAYKKKNLNIALRGKNKGIDENLDGILIKGDNFHALSYLLKKYNGRIKCIYIDPPYNTKNDNFCYKDNFIESSWLTFMDNRLRLAKELLRDDGVIFISIDNNEIENLHQLMNLIFGRKNFIENFIWTKTSTPPSLSKKSRRMVEYILCFEKNRTKIQYKGELTETGGDRPLLNRGNNFKVINFPKNSISTYLPDGIYQVGKYHRIEILNDAEVKDGKIINDLKMKGEFKWTQQTVNNEITLGTKFIIKSDKFSIRFIRSGISFKPPTNLIKQKFISPMINNKNQGVGTNETSKKEMLAMGLDFDSYPKPISLIKHLISFNTNSKMKIDNEKNEPEIILDFFAGSGTTAHAVIELYKEDGFNRKYIVVESEDYFDTVLKNRIEKAIFSKIWKDGKPISDNGVSQIVKYIHLEPFEDIILRNLKEYIKND